MGRQQEPDRDQRFVSRYTVLRGWLDESRCLVAGVEHRTAQQGMASDLSPWAASSASSQKSLRHKCLCSDTPEHPGLNSRW
jgi:hypothetical protein